MVQVKGLRVELAREGHDLFFGGGDRAEVAGAAHLQVFPPVFDVQGVMF